MIPKTRRKMSSAQRIALSNYLRKNIALLRIDRPTFPEVVTRATEKLKFKVTRGGFKEVMAILRYNWIPKPTRMPRPKLRDAALIEQFAIMCNQFNVDPLKVFAELIDTMKHKTQPQLPPKPTEPINSWHEPVGEAKSVEVELQEA